MTDIANFLHINIKNDGSTSVEISKNMKAYEFYGLLFSAGIDVFMNNYWEEFQKRTSSGNTDSDLILKSIINSLSQVLDNKKV